MFAAVIISAGFPIKPDYLSLIPEMHTMEGEKTEY